MIHLARMRKAVAAALGAAATLIVLVPEGMVSERWRPWVGLVLAAATVAGVYQAPNATPPRSRQDLAAHLPTRAARPGERPRRNLVDPP